jgi:hypothetical protein
VLPLAIAGHVYPSADPKTRYQLTDLPPDWPFIRTLYAVCGGDAWRADGGGVANVMLAPGASGTRALRAGPLFRGGYWAPGE